MRKPLLLLLIVSIFSSFLSPLNAGGLSLKPGVLDVNIPSGTSEKRTITIENLDNYKKELSLEASTYDPRTEEILTTKSFITLSSTKISIDPEEKVDIEYTIEIPKETPSGTYFNTITAEQVNVDGTIGGSLEIRMGLGSIIAIHVADDTTSVDKIFKENSSTQISIIKRGFPYLSNVVAEFSYTNNSDFVFRPQGEIRITDERGQQVASRVEINPQKKPLYKGQTITQRIEAPVWDIFNMTKGKTVSTRIYNGIGTEYIQNQVEINISTTAYILIGITSLLTLITVGKVYTILFKREKGSVQ